MKSRMARILGAALLLALGVFALRRAAPTEVPVSPGSWDPTD